MPALENFPPTRTAALERLAEFVPKAGRAYAAGRNTDAGPGAHSAVSTLSPYIRCRLITEPDVLEAVLGRHSAPAAEKFVQEVFWRAYWKGWLELRPAIWIDYLAELNRDWDDVQTQSGLRDRWATACRGDTGIDCFDFWAQELVDTGYLHNHARMWFASIWIFTLRLPWTLGADFFLRHLLDGDPASNTLSWRWVAGLQTRGKTYLARASNIAKYTDGRFAPSRGQLAAEAVPLDAPMPPAPRALPKPGAARSGLRTGFLLHGEDLSPGFALDGLAPDAAFCLTVCPGAGPLRPAGHVAAFRGAAAREAAERWASRLGGEVQASESIEELLEWAAREQLQQIVTPHAPVGPVAALLDRLEKTPDAPPLVQVLRAYDRMAWPHATKGFFPFKERIPRFLEELGLA